MKTPFKWILGTCFETKKGKYQVIQRTESDDVILGCIDLTTKKAFEIKEKEINEKWNEGLVFNHKLITPAFIEIIYENDKLILKIK
jgi:hypothetical protein